MRLVLKGFLVSLTAAFAGSWIGNYFFFEPAWFSAPLIWTSVGSFFVLTTGYAMLHQSRGRIESYAILLPMALIGGVTLLLPFSLVPRMAGIGMAYAFFTYAIWVSVHWAWTFAETKSLKESACG